MAAEQDPVAPDPDDFDRLLRELTSGVAEAAKFTEPSAAERAKQAKRGAPPPSRQGSAGWRNGRKARKLRRPAGQPPQPDAARAGQNRAADRRPQSRSARQQRRISAIRTIAILIGFAALILALHLLGFGPQ
ncbi:MAG TPA: hypothetical protein VLX31_13885 [Streptosporangiaceae bacterium]|nr:hypothetical protein [Streptosporangiaceae bacterium]